jgi:hypothetical protein
LGLSRSFDLTINIFIALDLSNDVRVAEPPLPSLIDTGGADTSDETRERPGGLTSSLPLGESCCRGGVRGTEASEPRLKDLLRSGLDALEDKLSTCSYTINALSWSVREQMSQHRPHLSWT